jgi:hypothetical protein
MQNCENRLNGISTQNTNEEGDLPKIEREAYEKGNMTFRNWTDTITEWIVDTSKYNYTPKLSNKIFSQLHELKVNEITLNPNNAVEIYGDLFSGEFKVGNIEYIYSIKNIPSPYKDEELFYNLSQQCTPAKIILDDGHYKIWEEPDPSRIYVAGVDISEGVGIDASVIQILDITDIRAIKQVAVYHTRVMPPLEFANKVYSVLRNWGSPLALIERNNCGAQVVDRLAFDMGYEKVVSYGAKVANRQRPQMGMIAHTNTKYKGVLNMRYFVNEVKAVQFRDIETLKELKDFVRYPNGVWRAKGTSHDDRVMSLIYALYILEKELTERYFDVVELDEQGKPILIEPMDFGVAMFEQSTSIYLDNEIMGIGSNYVPAIVFGMGEESAIDDIADLQAEGWMRLQ